MQDVTESVIRMREPDHTKPIAPALMSPAEVMEAVLLKGDLARLTPAERNSYYQRVCQSIGLNPLTRPLEYITLNGKMVLYARRDCADQLRKLHSVSIEILSKEYHDDLFSVHVRAKDATGRQDEDFGVVSLPPSMKGDVRANTILKAVTKAKRRVTLSIAGLGFLDESEVDDIPASTNSAVKDDGPPREALKLAAPQKDDPISSGPPRKAVDMKGDAAEKPITANLPLQPHKVSGENHTFESWAAKYTDLLKTSPDVATCYKWIDLNNEPLGLVERKKPSVSAEIKKITEQVMAMLRKAKEKSEANGRPDATDPEGFLRWLDNLLLTVSSPDELEQIYVTQAEPFIDDLMPPDRGECIALYNKHERRLGIE